jgi:hypothetical protein
MRSNIRLEFARCARPTRKSEALLLAAQPGRWVFKSGWHCKGRLVELVAQARSAVGFVIA